MTARHHRRGAGAVGEATACPIPGTPAAAVAIAGRTAERRGSVEHPTGEMTVAATSHQDEAVESAAILRTMRKPPDGRAFPA